MNVKKKSLRTRAHTLKPVVMLGQAGLKTSVIAEIEQALDSHELIKIKIQSDDRELRKKTAADICSHCRAICIQRIGKVIVIYRNNPDK